LRIMKAVWRRMKEAHADLYHFHDLDLIPLMMLWRILSGNPVVYDVHENYPEEMQSRYRIGKFKRFCIVNAVRFIEWLGAKVFRNMVLVVDSQRSRFEKKGRRVILMRNFASRSLGERTKDDLVSRSPAVLLLASAYVNNGLLLFLDVAQAVLAKRKDVAFYFVDRFGPDQVLRQQTIDRLKALDLGDRLAMLPNVLPDRVMDHVNRCTIGACFDLRTPSRIRALPTKLFEYMAGGVPIVATDLPHSKEYIEAARCGLLGRPEDPQTLADAIEHLLDHPQEAQEMAQRGRQAFLERFNWESQDEALGAFYRSILGRSTAGVGHPGCLAQYSGGSRPR
jgi:glycosyltransferase involved in cell wall biosynthesis